MPALEAAYPTDGSVQGPCGAGYRFFGKPSCGCSKWDCRPDSATAQRLGMTAARPTADYLGATVSTIVFLFGAATTGGAAVELPGPFDKAYAYAQAHGWHGPASQFKVFKDPDSGEEIRRTILGEFTV